MECVCCAEVSSPLRSPRAYNHKDAQAFHPRLTDLENGHIVLSNEVGGFSNWLSSRRLLSAAGVLVDN